MKNPLNKIIRLCRVFYLKLCGVEVSLSADVSWFSTIERMNGKIILGKNVFIDRGVVLRAHGGIIELGESCSVNCYSVLYGHGGLKIGNGVRIATHCVFIPANHNFSDLEIFIHKQGLTTRGIEVSDNVWFGAGVRVLDGVKIGSGCVIGAGAVLTKHFPGNSVVCGVPAKTIAHRKTPIKRVNID